MFARRRSWRIDKGMSENETTGQDALDALNALDEATPATAIRPRKTKPATSLSTGKTAEPSAAPAPREPRPAVSLRIPELPTWGPEDYGITLAGSGALKLADSGVAPLVALARGYARVDEGNFSEVMKTVGSKLNSKQGRRLKRTIGEGTGEGMTMPWYSIADLQNARRTGNSAEPICYQIRPARPEMGDNGRPLKYEFLFGGITPLDIHPAVPSTWIDSTPVVVIAEGLLKGDSALSAYLFENGASWEDLAGVGVEDPAARLAELLDAIPEANRLVIISIACIYNTSQNPVDWREINLKGREGWIAFDADLEENKFVYDAAVRLWKDLEGRARMGKMRILNPTSTTGDGGMIAKMGVDDYLAQVGQWSDLISFLVDELPAPPQRDSDEKAGNWRVSKDGCSAEECVPVMNGPGGTLSGYAWDEKVDLGGRIHGSDTRRQPTDSEIRRGVLDPNIGVDDVEAINARVEISWRAGGDKDGAILTAIVEGPENFLGYSPAEWDKRGARITTALLRHPSWPPRGVSGEKWLSAIKGHRVSDIVDSTRWMQMGWVPVEGHDPAFIIGDQVIGDPDMEPASVLPGVDSSELPVTGHYGVNKNAIDADWSDPRHVESMRQDLRDVIKAYVTDEPFTKRESVALILAAALRPVLPLRPRATCYLWGPKGGGKSWGAERMMAFWARQEGDWIGMLPGSAKDTFAYLENAVARANIWVVDDLAPSSNKRQVETENQKLEDLTRQIFNNATKGRMNADMTSRKVNKPVAQLIMTAENELTTPSARERLVPLYIGKGSLNPSSAPTDALEALHAEGTPARLSAHLIRYVRHQAAEQDGGWAAWMTNLDARVKHSQEIVSRRMKDKGAASGSLKRTATLAADLIIVFDLVRQFARYLGMERDIIELFSSEGLPKDLIELVHNAHAENQTHAPGVSVISALSMLLSMGRAHVAAAEDPLRPPLVDSDGQSDTFANMALGWVSAGSDGTLKGNGPRIGTVVTVHGERTILFDPQTAFKQAQDEFPDIIQHGQQPSAAWSSVWDEKLASDKVKRRKNGRGYWLTTHRVRVGEGSVTGVPVPVSTITKGTWRADSDLEDAVAEELVDA